MRLTPAKITKGKILGFILFFSFSAPAIPPVLKREATAASGRCLIRAIHGPADGDRILHQHQITTQGAEAGERQALARGLAQAQALLGREVSFAKNVHFVFAKRTGYSSYIGLVKGRHQIRMNRCDSKGKNCANNNVAHLMHELGHKVGHASFARGETFYEAYSRLAGQCYPTSYSRHNRNEEFAEVFAAYLTHPELLSEGSPSCQRAYTFFSKDVFQQNGEMASCEPEMRDLLLARSFAPVHGARTQVAQQVRSQSRAPARATVERRQVSVWLFDDRPEAPPEVWDEESEGVSGSTSTDWMWGR